MFGVVAGTWKDSILRNTKGHPKKPQGFETRFTGKTKPARVTNEVQILTGTLEHWNAGTLQNETPRAGARCYRTGRNGYPLKVKPDAQVNLFETGFRFKITHITIGILECLLQHPVLRPAVALQHPAKLLNGRICGMLFFTFWARIEGLFTRKPFQNITWLHL